MSNYRNISPDALATQFKALGHPHRLRIFTRLAACCSPGIRCGTREALHRCVGELAAELDIAPSTVSHHLKELTRSGLIAARRQGREIHCSVDPTVLHALRRFFAGFAQGQLTGEEQEP